MATKQTSFEKLAEIERLKTERRRLLHLFVIHEDDDKKKLITAKLHKIGRNLNRLTGNPIYG